MIIITLIIILHYNLGGGQHVNPAVTVSMWSLGKCTYTEAFVRIAGQMGGGLVSFPLFQFVSEQFNLTPFGGPEFSQENNVDAFLSEFFASFLLMWAIYIVRILNLNVMVTTTMMMMMISMCINLLCLCVCVCYLFSSLSLNESITACFKNFSN